ncbi:hypothetical protein OG542_39860 [Streptomyces violaceus]|uniref:hypothetical protein n=1 Tax=Streptomyces violaceus TaxID=1936 RepID=UPI002E1EC6D1
MARITRIEAHVRTADVPHGGTQGWIADFGEDRRLWLGQEYGKQLHLKRYND